MTTESPNLLSCRPSKSRLIVLVVPRQCQSPFTGTVLSDAARVNCNVSYEVVGFSLEASPSISSEERQISFFAVSLIGSLDLL